MGLIVMLKDWLAVCAGVPESVAVTVNATTPDAVGVPDIAEPLRLIPAGNVPVVTLQLIVPVPPVAASEALYAVPTTPFESEVVVIANWAGLIVRLNCCVADTGPC